MPEAKPTRDQTSREADIASLKEKIRELRHEEAVKRSAAEAFVEECKGAGLDPITGTSDADRDAFNRIDRAYKDADTLAEQAKDFENRLSRLLQTSAIEAEGRAKGDLDHPDVRRSLSMAAAFMASQGYKQLRASGALDMHGASVKTPAVTVASREQLMAALFGATNKAAWLEDVDALVPDDQRLFPPVPVPVRQLRVRDLISVSTTETDTVEYVEETIRQDLAGETSYGAAAPASTYEYERREVPVKRIPHHVKATKGNLADAGQLRNLLDSRLVYGVGKRLDTQMINGDGIGDNITGILNTPNLQDVDATGESVTDAFHKGLTAVRLSLEDEPDAFLVHPTNYEQFVLAKGSDDHYKNLQGPQLSAPPNIWGKNTVVSTVMPANTALVGNWAIGATLWLRSGIQLAVTDSDSDDFLKGIITILAEMRAAFAAVQVNAFAEIIELESAT
jgi:HK97 family phage major capsid protein